MSDALQQKIEVIQEFIEKLARESLKGTPIIVEGKNDMKILRKLNVMGDIILAKTSGKSFLTVLSEVEESGKKEVIILTDFDRRGREWAKNLKLHLERMRIKPNLLFWSTLRKLVSRDVKDIEGLRSYLKTLKEKKRSLYQNSN